jgi:hypothetical protein
MPEPELVAEAAPFLRELRHLVAHLDRHVHRLQARIWTGHGIVEDDEKPVTSEALDRPLVFVSKRSQGDVIFTHDLKHLLRRVRKTR